MAPFPARVGAMLQQAPLVLTEGAELTTQRECEGAKFHSPRPLLVRRVRIAQEPFEAVEGRGYPHDASVWLCGTCEANLAIYVSLLDRAGGTLPWEVRREFGNQLRAVAERCHARPVDGTDPPT